jgi:dihydrofolate reductase
VATVGKLKLNLTMSLDGYIAGPDQSEENPLGIGGMGLHDWALELEAWRKPHGREGGEVNASTAVIEQQQDAGAVIMGRNMFGPVRGDWGEDPWRGWWGDEPPFHVPVFVLTHHQRDPLEMDGGTTFTFVTDGIEAALERARDVAGDRDVAIGGGAQTAQQYLAAGLLEQITISVVPTLLGDGARLFEGLGGAGLELEAVSSIEAPGVTHLSYRLR